MSIIKFEFEKVLKNRLFLSLITISIIAIVGSVIWSLLYNTPSLHQSSPNSESFGQEVVQTNEEYTNFFAGELTDERIEQILTYEIAEINAGSMGGSRDIYGSFSYFVARTFVKDFYTIDEKVNSAKENGKELQLSDIDVYSLEDLNFYGSKGSDTAQTKLKIGNFVSWNALYALMESTFVLMAIITISITATLFSSEFSSGTLALFFTTKYGRTKMVLGKLWTSLILTFLLFTAAQIIIFATFCYFFGLNGWDVNIQANLYWQIYDFPLALNNLQVFFLGCGFQLVALLTVASITCLISSVTKNPFSSLAVGLSLYFVPQIVQNMVHTSSDSLITKIFKLFPANNYKIGEMLATLRSGVTFFFDGFFANLFFLLTLWIVIKIASDCFIYFRMKYLSLE